MDRKKGNFTDAIHSALNESKGKPSTKKPVKQEDNSPGAQCGIGSVVEFEYDGQLLIGTVSHFGRYGLIHIATDANRPMYHHVVGKALIKRIIKLV